MMKTTGTIWLSSQDLADELGVPVSTVYAWNYKGTGPRLYRLGRHVRYRRADVDAWIETQAVAPHPPA